MLEAILLLVGSLGFFGLTYYFVFIKKYLDIDNYE